MKRSVYISPHLDDAVLSCCGKILTESSCGKKVVVLTVFSGTGRQSSDLFRDRRLEDTKALKILGASPKRLNLADAFFRRSFYYRSSETMPSMLRLTQRTHAADRSYVRTVALRLAVALKELEPDQVYAPLGVGTHIDHRLVFFAAVKLLTRWNFKFYEDRPYALVPFAVRFRLNQIGWRAVVDGGAADMRPLRKDAIRKSYLRSMFESGFVDKNEMLDFRNAVEGKFRSRINLKHEIKSEIFHPRPRDLAVMGNAITAYQSQAAFFCGSPANFFAEIRKQGRALGESSRYFERYWSLD